MQVAPVDEFNVDMALMRLLVIEAPGRQSASGSASTSDSTICYTSTSALSTITSETFVEDDDAVAAQKEVCMVTAQVLAARLREMTQDIATNLKLSAHYTYTDIKRRPRNCIIGFAAVFLVVFCSMLVLSATTKTSYLLLRFAELSVGEMDSVVYANGVVNYTSVKATLATKASSSVSGTSPRWVARGVLRSWDKLIRTNASNVTAFNAIPSLAVNIMIVDAANEPAVGIGRSWPYRQVGYGEAHVTDAVLEYLGMYANIGDRSNVVVPLNDMLAQQTVDVPSSVVSVDTSSINLTTPAAAAALQVIEGLASNANVVVNVTTMGQRNVTEATIPATAINISSLLRPSFDFNVADAITDTFGKYPAALGNVMLMDYRRLPWLLADQSCVMGSTVFTANGGATALSPLGADGVEGLIDGFDMSAYALLVVAMFHDRFQTYYKGSADLGNDMIRNSNDMLLALDYRFAGDVSFPVAAAMEGFQTFTAIITALFVAIVMIILVLSAILVYSLLGMNSEERQFELAMIRSQGMTTTQLLYIMSTEMMVFVLPGVACGTGMGIAANALLERVLSNFVKTPFEPFRMPAMAYVVAITAGVLMPVASNWTPVMESLRASLRDALDINRQAWSETFVSMTKLGDLGLELWQTLLGLFLVVAGFMVYYLLPLSFLYSNLVMFFLIMNIVLLIMLFGLCLVVFSLQGVVSQLWLWLLLWGPDKRLATLVSKNMEAHRSKSDRAFVTFILCIASVIFGGIAFRYLANALTQTLQIASGADLVVTSTSFNTPLNVTGLDAYLSSTEASLYVASWSYVTFALQRYPQVMASGGTSLKNILGRRRSMQVVGVTENYVETVFDGFVAFGELEAGLTFPTTTTGVVDAVRSLYTEPNASAAGHAATLYTGFPNGFAAPDALHKAKFVMPVLLATGVRDSMGIDTTGVAAMEFTYRLQNGRAQTTDFLVQPRALLDRLPGFAGVSPRRTGVSSGAMVMSIGNFRNIILPNETDFYGVPSSTTELASGYVADVRFEKLLVRVHDGVNDRQRAFFLNSLRAHLDSYSSSSTDVAQGVKTTEQVSELLSAFFYFCAGICVLLASFMIWMVFVSNVTQHAWSFGVLRSLGFTQAHVLRVVMYEALVLVLSSFTLGVPIGVFVGFTLGLQMSTFLNLPLDLRMPYEVLLVLFSVSIAATAVGSAVPMRTLNRLPVAIVVKKFN